MDVSRSILIGDKPTDLEAALAADIQGCLYSSGNLVQFLKPLFAPPWKQESLVSNLSVTVCGDYRRCQAETTYRPLQISKAALLHGEGRAPAFCQVGYWFLPPSIQAFNDRAR